MNNEYDMGVEIALIGAVDKVLKSYGYNTDAFEWGDDFDYSKMAEQVVAWAEDQKMLLEETA